MEEATAEVASHPAKKAFAFVLTGSSNSIKVKSELVRVALNIAPVLKVAKEPSPALPLSAVLGKRQVLFSYFQ